MRSFCFAALCAFALIFGCAWYWVLARPMLFLDEEYPMWKAKTFMLDTCQIGRLDTIGDSKGVASIIPAKVGPAVVNLNFGGIGLVELLKISRLILACPQPPEAVVLSIHIIDLATDRVLWERAMKFGLLHFNYNDLEQIRRLERQYGDTNPYLYGEPTPLDIDGRLEEILYLMKFPAYYFSALINARIDHRLAENKIFLKQTALTRGQHHFGMHKGNWTLSEFSAEPHFAPDPFQQKLFADLIDLYAEHHVPLYFVSPPYNQLDVDRLRPTLIEDYRTYLESYEKSSPNFKVIGDLFPALPPEDFGDLDHPNPKGAAEWSERFRQLLIANHVPGGPFEPTP